MNPLTILHALVTLWLTAYGLNSLILALLYLYHSQTTPPDSPASDRASLPPVTVQVPIYNERHVVERVIDAVATFDYPRDRLQIQVLDDSTDETTRLARERAAYHRKRGVDISVLRRPDRSGFKAGALSWGLSQARSDYIAVFDADFCPRPDFLLETVPHFLERPRLGLVQARWAHLNADYSLLTRAQAMAFDGHFVVEQAGRNRSGLLMNFNGTAGVWRKQCIEEAGGWKSDTLSEDLDLSYRAQLAGWKCLYLPEADAPAELPPQVAAFKRQQSRWAQGSIQTLRKLTAPLLRSKQLNWVQKVMGLAHLSSYLAHALMVLHLLLTLPLLLSDAQLFSLGSLGLIGLSGPPLVYTLSQQRLYPDWMQRMKAFPFLMIVGIGIAWNNTRAVWRGLRHWGGTFARTPKFQLELKTDRWADSQYRFQVDNNVIGEALLALYALITTLVAQELGYQSAIPFLLVYIIAFGSIAVMGVTQALEAHLGHPLTPELLLTSILDQTED